MLSTLTTKANIRRAAWVSADPLNVTPELLGAPLAKPARRATAMGLDLLVIAFLSQLDGFWLGAALVVFLYHMRAKEQGQTSWLRNAWLLGLCALCLWLAAERGWQTWGERNNPNTATVNGAGSAVQFDTSVAPGAKPQPAASATNPSPGDPSTPASAVTSAPTTTPLSSSDSDRIEALEAELAEARKPKVFRWKSELENWWEELGVGFGWAIAYFALVPAWLRGQTLGKKLLGLRVVELTGKPLTVRICFSRYGGYIAGMATGGFGFAQIMWDDNRQSIQDKVAHTVVIDLHAPYEAATPPPETEVPSVSSQKDV